MSAKRQLDQVCGSVFDACHTKAKNEIGTRVRFDDGREFVYCKTSADFVAGEVISAPAASAVTANVMVAANIGATTVYGVLAGTTADLYANGYLFLTDDTGQGYTLRIKSNTAAATVAGVANTVTFTLYDPLKVAIDTSTDFVVMPDLYTLVVEGGATTRPIGVAVVPTTGTTATCYFWVQTHGPAVALCTSASSLAVGAMVCAAASGGIGIATGTTATTIGYCLSAAEDANGFQPIYLWL